jgi:hypothetical protein
MSVDEESHNIKGWLGIYHSGGTDFLGAMRFEICLFILKSRQLKDFPDLEFLRMWGRCSRIGALTRLEEIAKN